MILYLLRISAYCYFFLYVLIRIHKKPDFLPHEDMTYNSHLLDLKDVLLIMDLYRSVYALIEPSCGISYRVIHNSPYRVVIRCSFIKILLYQTHNSAACRSHVLYQIFSYITPANYEKVRIFLRKDY